MTYLVCTSKKHHTVAHMLAPDGQHALCTARPGEKTWPRVGGHVAGGEWIIGEDAGDRLVCKRCERKEKRPLKVATRAERKRAEELEQLRVWNEAARQANPDLTLDNGGELG